MRAVSAHEKPAAAGAGRVKVKPQIAGALATESVYNLALKACLGLHHGRVKIRHGVNRAGRVSAGDHDRRESRFVKLREKLYEADAVPEIERTPVHHVSSDLDGFVVVGSCKWLDPRNPSIWV